MIVSAKINPISASFDFRRDNTQTDFLRHGPASKSELKRLSRKHDAEAFAALLKKNADVYMLGKGNFFVIDVILAVAEKIGPCHASLSTWTIGPKEIDEIKRLLDQRKFLSCRWLLDVGMPQREGPRFAKMLELFGAAKVRTCQNHAKVFLLNNDEWNVSLISSANFNMNPRYEWYWLREGDGFFKFNNSFFEEYFDSHK